MPYITEFAKKELEPELSALITKLIHKPEGVINYVFSTIAKEWTRGYGYSILNSMLGVFEASKLEFYRRVIAPYEDKKIQENGDVY